MFLFVNEIGRGCTFLIEYIQGGTDIIYIIKQGGDGQLDIQYISGTTIDICYTYSYSFSSIKTIGEVGSGRKIKKMSRVYAHASVGPLLPAVLSISTSSSVNILQTESESRMGSVSVNQFCNGI